VCYAEKTQQQALPYISSTKSAQQILGAVMKKLLMPTLCATPAPLSCSTPAAEGDGAMFSSLFIVSVQPCFDKKLESSRLDFFHEDEKTSEVDLVISTSELWTLLEEQAATSPNAAASSSLSASSSSSSSSSSSESASSSNAPTIFDLFIATSPDAPHGRDEIERMFRSFSIDGAHLVASADANGGSGGFLDYIFRFAAERIMGVNLWEQPLLHAQGEESSGGGGGGGEGGGGGAAVAAAAVTRPPLQFKQGKNSDFEEVELIAPAVAGAGGSEVLEDAAARGIGEGGRRLVFAKAYGFRNIQSIMLKMRKGKCDFDFIEIMACPSGCVNGGGQLRAELNESPAQTRERVGAVDVEFHRSLVHKPEEALLVQYLYTAERLKTPLSEEARALLHTRYHAVPKLEVLAPLAAKW